MCASLDVKSGILDYYFITNRKLSHKPVEETVADAIAGGARIVQYREKDLPLRETVMQARKVADVCRAAGALIIIDGHLDIAVSLDADGIHVSNSGPAFSAAREAMGKDKIIGVSAKGVRDAVDAARAGADYVALGPIFEKRGGRGTDRALGPKGIMEAKGAAGIPLVGIGGITVSNCAEAVRAGADGVCAISDVVGSSDIPGRVAEFLRAVREEKRILEG